MKFSKLAIAGLLGATAIVPPQKARAFFGPVCIPTIHTCYCTFLIPCPILDIERAFVEGLTKKVANNLNSELTEANLTLNKVAKSYGGSQRGSLSAFDSLGIDLTGLIPEQVEQTLNKLNELDAELIANIKTGSEQFDSLKSQIESIGIDAARITLPTPKGIVNGLGQLAEDRIPDISIGLESLKGVEKAISEIESQAYNLVSISSEEMLNKLSSSAGIDIRSSDFMKKLVAADISSSDLMAFASQQGITTEALQAAGVKIDTISRMTAGSFRAEDLLDISGPLGIRAQALEALDIGKSALKKLADGEISKQDYIIQTQKLGLDQKQLDRIGITQEKLANIESGPVSDRSKIANDVAESAAGPDPKTTAIPVAKDSNLDIKDETNPEGGATSSMGETCSTDFSLISDITPPHTFGDDVAQIDMDMTTGDIDDHLKSLQTAMKRSKEAEMTALARSIQLKNILKKAYENYETFENAIGEQESIGDDFKLNDAIKLQLMMAKAEATSIYTFIASATAGEVINPKFIQPTPVLPHNQDYRENHKKGAGAKSTAQIEKSNKQLELSKDLTNFQDVARELQGQIDKSRSAERLKAGIPSLVSSIEYHELIKQDLLYLEDRIRTSAEIMFVDGDQAASRIIKDLKSHAGKYSDGHSRWYNSSAIVNQIQSKAVSMQSPYGSRIITQAETEDQAGQAATPYMPYYYPVIDTHSTDEPYTIIRPKLPRNREDDDTPPPPPLAGLFQYYLETLRREAYYGEMRRGPANDTMTAAVWNELATYAPDCLAGPIPSTPENLTQRPDLFDLSTTCSHLTYFGGDAEDYISPRHLGGTDAVLWNSKVLIDLAQPIYGIERDLEAEMQTLTQNGKKIIERAKEIGYDGWASEVERILKPAKLE